MGFNWICKEDLQLVVLLHQSQLLKVRERESKGNRNLTAACQDCYE